MRVTSGFRAFVLDQLSDLSGIRDRAMFGGVGLYAGDTFFGILAADVLYLKVDDSTRAAYEAAGSRPLQPYADRAITMPYYAVPPGVLEAPAALLEWATAAIGVARASASKRPVARARKTARRR